MAMILTMALSVNLSAGAASSENGWWGDSSGTQTGSIEGWLNDYIGSQGNGGSLSGISGQTIAAPSNITILSKMTTNYRNMKISWDKVEGAQKYILQMSTTEDFTGDDVRESTVKGTSYQYTTQGLTGVYYYPAHMTYYFRVKAVSGYRESAWSRVAVSRGDV